MSNYHINPNTGNPNQCRAGKKACPFVDHGEHFESKEDARANYELIMTALEENLTVLQRKMKDKFTGVRTVSSEKENDLRDYFQSFGLQHRNQYKKWEKMGLTNNEINELVLNELQRNRSSAQTLKSLGWI